METIAGGLFKELKTCNYQRFQHVQLFLAQVHVILAGWRL